jgi:hypothetical protein
MTDFSKDLSFGKTWESVAMRMVGGAGTQSIGAFKDWDFKVGEATYEVKSDRLAYKFGGKTMFIEHECSGKPSGIRATKADYWVYFMVRPNGEYTAYRIPTADLKEATKGCRQVSGGDGMRSRGFIVPVKSEWLFC